MYSRNLFSYRSSTNYVLHIKYYLSLSVYLLLCMYNNTYSLINIKTLEKNSPHLSPVVGGGNNYAESIASYFQHRETFRILSLSTLEGLRANNKILENGKQLPRNYTHRILHSIPWFLYFSLWYTVYDLIRGRDQCAYIQATLVSWNIAYCGSHAAGVRYDTMEEPWKSP